MALLVQEQSCQQLLDNCFSMCSTNSCFTDTGRTGYVQWVLLSTGDLHNQIHVFLSISTPSQFNLSPYLTKGIAICYSC